MASKYQVQLFDAQTGAALGDIFQVEQPYSFNAGDVYMFNPSQGAPIQRVSHLIGRFGSETVFTTILLVSRPAAHFNDVKLTWPEGFHSTDNPVPWPW